MKQVVPLLALLVLCVTISYTQGYSDQSVFSGIGFAHSTFDDTVEMPMGAGSAWFDYNNDGLLDLYVCNRIGANKFFENNGNGTFTEKAASLGIDDALNDGVAVVIGDINNDGYQDIYLGNSAENILFLNNQGSSFTDITMGSGLESIGANRTTSGSFGDFNKDGYLDLFVTHHIGLATTGIGTPHDYLFLNNGDRTFTDVSNHLDTLIIQDPGFASSWTDFDKDGDQDLIIVNDCPFGSFPNNGTFLYENLGGTDAVTDWQFAEIGVTHLENDCANGMGIGIGDYNRDGYMDLAYSNIGPARLFKNNEGTFESQDEAGMSTQPIDHFSWGLSFMDFDNDGWQDVVMAVGSLTNQNENVDSTQECNFFHNNGDETFTELANTLGIDDADRTRSIIHGDYDNDGDLDLLLMNYDGEIRLFRNDEVNANHYLRIKLRSKKSAPDGIGSWIEVKTNDGVKQYFEMRSGTNLGGGDEIYAHFGLGTATMIDSIKVSWMSGEESILTNIGVDTVLTIKEPSPYIYVRKGATGDGDGSDWANAYTELTSALAVASFGDTVLVADGTYLPTDDLTEEKSFLIKDGICLIGGFPATGGTLAERDLVGLNTILSGFIGEGGSGEKSYNVVKVEASASTSCIDGFTIMHGEADGILAQNKQGGAIFCEGTMLINNIKMVDNDSELAGSNICTQGTSAVLTMRNTQIIASDLSKPVISVDANSTVNIEESCTIED